MFNWVHKKNKKQLDSRTFNQRANSGWFSGARAQKKGLVIGAVLGLIIIIIGGWILINYSRAKKVLAAGLAAKQSLLYAQVAIGDQNFELAIKDLTAAQQHFSEANQTFKRFTILKSLPLVKSQIVAVENLLGAGENLTKGLTKLTIIGRDVFGVMDMSGSEITFNDISAEEKKAALAKLAAAPVELQVVRQDLEAAITLIENIPQKNLLKPVRAAVEPVREQLPTLTMLINQVLPIAEAIPSISGYPNEKTYLFLLQNNRELRPAGGFIGTYGIVKLHNGEIIAFQTDNSYNLDSQASDRVTEPAPGPIQAHTSTDNWLLRDANWSPDFPTSAKKARDKYLEEGGEEQMIDGVIAVTPSFIESLLKLTGPITVDQLEFTTENFFNKLQMQVEFGFKDQGIDFVNRKGIIGTLGTELMNGIFSLPKDRFADLWKTFIDNVNEKQILIYVDEAPTQQLVTRENWTGEMKNYEGDYVMVVDANLAALKTDDVMERELTYKVRLDDDEYIGNLEMRYKNNGNFSKIHTRYRTWTRIYLPEGIELMESSGFLTADKLHNGRATNPEVYKESFTNSSSQTIVYTVVAGFTAIEPQQEGSIVLRYKLPANIKDQIEKQGRYQIYVQKQAGTIGQKLNFTVDINREIKGYTPLDNSQKNGNNEVQFSSDLKVDRQFTLNFQ